MTPRILILGLSHTRALASALRPGEAASIEIHNLRDLPGVLAEGGRGLSLGLRDWGRPDLLVLAMCGNLHNVVALKENPMPFRLGDARDGCVPADEARHFVPRDMLREHFSNRLRRSATMERQAHEHFPGVPVVHLAAPPPVRSLRPVDPDGPPLQGVALMVRFLAFDPANNDLRVRIHAVQTHVDRQSARRLGAPFLLPPVAAVAPDGFLDDRHWDEDPTHGNARYGRLVLDEVLAHAAALQPAER